MLLVFILLLVHGKYGNPCTEAKYEKNSVAATINWPGIDSSKEHCMPKCVHWGHYDTQHFSCIDNIIYACYNEDNNNEPRIYSHVLHWDIPVDIIGRMFYEGDEKITILPTVYGCYLPETELFEWEPSKYPGLTECFDLYEIVKQYIQTNGFSVVYGSFWWIYGRFKTVGGSDIAIAHFLEDAAWKQDDWRRIRVPKSCPLPEVHSGKIVLIKRKSSKKTTIHDHLAAIAKLEFCKQLHVIHLYT